MSMCSHTYSSEAGNRCVLETCSVSEYSMKDKVKKTSHTIGILIEKFSVYIDL